MTLKLLGQKPREDDPFYQQILKEIAESDGFIVLLLNNKADKWQWRRYNLSDVEVAYALLLAQKKLFEED